MPEDGGNWPSGQELAFAFYMAHELDFRRAAEATADAARIFDFPASRFDDWAVAAGHMPRPVREAEGVEAAGLTRIRGQIRARLNRAARRRLGVERGYSIEARGGRWRVVLAERYVIEKPREDVDGLWKAYEHVGRNVDRLKKQIRDMDLDEEERFLALAHLEYVASFTFWGIQQVQAVAHRINPNAQHPDMRKLGREMGKLVSNAYLPQPKQRRAPRSQSA